MRHLVYILLLSLLVIVSASAQPLLPIIEKGYYGYIDTTGRMVIAPRFHEAGAFVGGVAPVREDGLYGYIDATGRYRIPPRYDYAEAFDPRTMRARTWIDGAITIIDRSGAAGVSYRDDVVELIGPLDSALFLVRREVKGAARAWRYRYGVIDRAGRTVLEPLYSSVSLLGPTLMLTTRGELNEYHEWENVRDEIFDRAGRRKLLLGDADVGYFSDGMASVIYPDTVNGVETSRIAYIDTSGTLALRVSDSVTGDVSALEGRLRRRFSADVSAVRPFIDGRGAILLDSGRAVIVRRDGRVTPLPLRVNQIRMLRDGRLLVDTANNRWLLIDDRGRQMTPRHYDAAPADIYTMKRSPLYEDVIPLHRKPLIFLGRHVPAHGESSGSDVWYAMTPVGKLIDSFAVESDGLVVDSHAELAGRFFMAASVDIGEKSARTPSSPVLPSVPPSISWTYDPNAIEGLLWMSRERDGETTIRLWDPRRNRTTDSFTDTGGVWKDAKGLIAFHTAERSVYYTRAGRHAYTEWRTTAPGFVPLNLDHMRLIDYPKWYPTASRPETDLLNLWTFDSLLYHPAPTDAPADAVTVMVTGDPPARGEAGATARSVWIVNGTDAAIGIEGIDGTLPMIMEARNEAGEWREIERLDDYVMLGKPVPLAPGTALRTALAEYEGSIPVMLRLRLLYYAPGSSTLSNVYSNEFPGSINPGQWWRPERMPELP